MKLSTSAILARLSEQDRHKVELELAELHHQSQQLLQRQHDMHARIAQLNRQRDQAMRNRHAAALLQAFDLSLNELRGQLTLATGAMQQLELQKQTLLRKFAEIYRSQYAYESIHDKQQRHQRRQAEQKNQRQLDDMVAARRSLPAT